MPRMFNPAYPGLTLCDDVLPALGPNVTEAVTKLDDSAALLVALRHVASAHGKNR